ncbi:MAG: sigma-70 family RNA polymerase sigma factor [Planctomycetota bacterium]
MLIREGHVAFDFMATLARARAHEPRALDALFEAFYAPVSRMVHQSLARDMRRSRPWLTARFSTGDVVQEVFRSVLQDLGGFMGQSADAFVGYLALVVRNRIFDAVRFHEASRRDGRRTGELSALHDRATGADDPCDVVANTEGCERLQRALEQLPEHERLLLRARFEESESFAWLAESLGYPSVSTARRAFYAAQARLALLLGSE